MVFTSLEHASRTAFSVVLFIISGRKKEINKCLLSCVVCFSAS